MPKTMKSIKVITRVTEELIRQSVVPVDSALSAKLVRDVAGILDDAFLTGTGNPDGGGNLTRPKGVLNMTGTTTLAGIGAVDLDDLHDALAALYGVNADPETGRYRWMMTSRTFISLRKIKDNQGRYQLQPDPTSKGGFTLLGIPVTVTNRIPANGGAGSNEASIILADWVHHRRCPRPGTEHPVPDRVVRRVG